jgi:hypothetical protein
MPAFLLGVVALLLLLWAASAFINADPKQGARLLRWIGGGTALLLAAFLLFRGEIAVAVPIGAFGLGLLGWTSFWPAPFGARTQRTTGQASRARTAFLEMELDHDTGRMHGRVLAGGYQGASLDALDRATLMKLLREIDADSRDLLAAYLDRREPGWREYAQRDAGAGLCITAKSDARLPLWVISCRGAVKLECPLYPRKLPRLPPSGAAVMGQKQTFCSAAIDRTYWGMQC